MNKYFLILFTSILLVSCGGGTSESSTSSQDSTKVSSDSLCTESHVDTLSVDSLQY